jgi:hypothetical protein
MLINLKIRKLNISRSKDFYISINFLKKVFIKKVLY